MKYLIIIIILFLFIIYYNLVLSRRNIELIKQNKKYRSLKKKLNRLDKHKPNKKVSFVLDNMEQESLVDNMTDSIFGSQDHDINNVNNNEFGELNVEEQSFALFSDEY